MQAILEDPSDQTRVRLLFANSSEADMLMADELHDYVVRSQGQIEVQHLISKVCQAHHTLTERECVYVCVGVVSRCRSPPTHSPIDAAFAFMDRTHWSHLARAAPILSVPTQFRHGCFVVWSTGILDCSQDVARESRLHQGNDPSLLILQTKCICIDTHQPQPPLSPE
jgi:hypothetical protein